MDADQVSPGTPTAEVANEVDDGFATLVNRFCEEQVAFRARLAGGRRGCRRWGSSKAFLTDGQSGWRLVGQMCPTPAGNFTVCP